MATVNTIKIKRGKSAPTSSILSDGELGFDKANQYLYIGTDSGVFNINSKAIADSDNNAINTTYLKKSGVLETSVITATSVDSRTTAGKLSVLRIYGTTYGNTAGDVATPGQFTYGDPGPQIQFSSTAEDDTNSQNLALIFTNHNSLGAETWGGGACLSLVGSNKASGHGTSDADNCYFIAPYIKALNGFIGNLTGNVIGNVTGDVTGNATNDGNGNNIVNNYMHLKRLDDSTTYTIDTMQGLLSTDKIGQAGSIKLSDSYWYNYLFMPHCTTSGAAGTNYGTTLLFPMTTSGASYIVRRNDSTSAATEIKEILTVDTNSNFKNVLAVDANKVLNLQSSTEGYLFFSNTQVNGAKGGEILWQGPQSSSSGNYTRSRMVLRAYSPVTKKDSDGNTIVSDEMNSYYENYQLPLVDADRTAVASYKIYTTKNITWGTSLPSALNSGDIFLLYEA